MDKSYLIDYDISKDTYNILCGEDFFEWINVDKLAENVAPGVIHAAIYNLLEALKPKQQIDGRTRADARE